MEPIFYMENWLFAIVCTPICTVTTVLNIVFIFCLCQPAKGVSIRQPLHFLLVVVLGNSTGHQLNVMMYAILGFFRPPFLLLVVSVAVIYQTFCFSFSTCAWISVFYYLKIVPQRHVIFIWIKKNIKAIVLAGFIFDQVLLLSAVTFHSMAYLIQQRDSNSSETDHFNGTILGGVPDVNETFLELGIKMFCLYFIFPVITLTFTWGRTFYYLRGHIKTMQSTSSSSNKQKNQMRVTKMGIVQTAVFFPSSLWAIFTALFIAKYKYLDSDKHITITITTLCGLANILCLGSSQSVFRVGFISLFKRFKKVFG